MVAVVAVVFIAAVVILTIMVIIIAMRIIKTTPEYLELQMMSLLII